MSGTDGPLLQARDVSRVFDVKGGGSTGRGGGRKVAVDAVNLSVQAGEVHVLMGLSGSGKSTLLRMFNRLVVPTSGTVEFDGTDLARLDDNGIRDIRNRRINMVFQHFALFPHYTVRQNVGYGLRLRGVPTAEVRTRADEALASVGLENSGDNRPDELSGGMRQRVGLARALATGGDVLLMDEPFSALDPLIRGDLQQQVRALVKELGKTVVFVTHDINEALLLGDRITLLRDGRVVQTGDVRQILDTPADDYVRRFIQEVDRGRVLTAADVVTAPGNWPHPQPELQVPSTTSLAVLAGSFGGESAATVVAEGEVVGFVRAADVLSAISGLHPFDSRNVVTERVVR